MSCTLESEQPRENVPRETAYIVDGTTESNEELRILTFWEISVEKKFCSLLLILVLDIGCPGSSLHVELNFMKLELMSIDHDLSRRFD